MLDECSLKRVKVAGLPNPFERDLVSVERYSELQGRVGVRAVDQHRARAALSVTAPLLCADRVKLVEQEIKKGSPGFNREPPLLTVDLENRSDLRDQPAGQFSRRQLGDRRKRASPRLPLRLRPPVRDSGCSKFAIQATRSPDLPGGTASIGPEQFQQAVKRWTNNVCGAQANTLASDLLQLITPPRMAVIAARL
jgi:hypothetical protein